MRMGEWESVGEWASSPVLPRSLSPARIPNNRRQIIIALGAQQRILNHRPRCDDAHDIALDEPLDLFRVFKLFDEHNLVTLVNQFRDVRLDVMMRYTRPRQARAFGERACGEDEFEFARGDFGIGVERLVKIAGAKEDERSGESCFDLPVL